VAVLGILREVVQGKSKRRTTDVQLINGCFVFRLPLTHLHSLKKID